MCRYRQPNIQLGKTEKPKKPRTVQTSYTVRKLIYLQLNKQKLSINFRN